MEETQAIYWADIAQQILVSKSMSAIPSMDPRTIGGQVKAYNGLAYADIYRVNAKSEMDTTGPVQIIALNGPLMVEDYCGAPGMATMQQAIRAANADNTIESIVLFNNSPGGTVAGTANLATEVKNSKKPVVSFVSNMMCSADYWIGSSASEIIADDEAGGYNSYIGSIGTKAVIMDRSKEMENRGVRLIEVTADTSSRKTKYSSDILSGDYTRLKTELNAINQVFMNSVKENRNGKLNLDKENVLDGETYNVKQALKYGLIDKTGSFEYAVKRSLQMAKSIK